MSLRSCILFHASVSLSSLAISGSLSVSKYNFCLLYVFQYFWYMKRLLFSELFLSYFLLITVCIYVLSTVKLGNCHVSSNIFPFLLRSWRADLSIFWGYQYLAVHWFLFCCSFSIMMFTWALFYIQVFEWLMSLESNTEIIFFWRFICPLHWVAEHLRESGILCSGISSFC